MCSYRHPLTSGCWRLLGVGDLWHLNLYVRLLQVHFYMICYISFGKNEICFVMKCQVALMMASFIIMCPFGLTILHHCWILSPKLKTEQDYNVLSTPKFMRFWGELLFQKQRSSEGSCHNLKLPDVEPGLGASCPSITINGKSKRKEQNSGPQWSPMEVKRSGPQRGWSGGGFLTTLERKQED